MSAATLEVRMKGQNYPTRKPAAAVRIIKKLNDILRYVHLTDGRVERRLERGVYLTYKDGTAILYAVNMPLSDYQVVRLESFRKGGRLGI